VKRLDLAKWILKERRGLVVMILVCGIIAGVATVLTAVGIGRFYELAFGSESARTQFLPFLHAPWASTLPMFVFLFSSIVTVRFAATWMSRYLSRVAGELIVERIRNATFSKQLRIDLGYYRKHGYGHYLLRWSADLVSIQNYFTLGVFQFGADALLIALAFTALGLIYFKGFCLVLALTLGMFVILFGINRMLYRVAARRRRAKSGLLKFVNSRLRAIESLKAYNKEKPESKKFAKRSASLLKHGRRYHAFHTLVQSAASTYVYMLIGSLFFLVLLSPASARPPQGQLVTAVMILVTTSHATRRMLGATSVWQLGRLSFESLSRVHSTQEQKQSAKTKKLRVRDGQISFDSVVLSRRFENSAAGCAIDLVVGRGEISELELPDQKAVGHFGRIFAGLGRHVQGKIRIDGRSIRAVAPRSLRKKVALLSDSMPLVGSTVYECMSHSGSKRGKKIAAECLAALREASGIGSSLGIDDRISEDGWNLSGAELSLIRLARALLTRKPILIVTSPCEMAGLIRKLANSPGQLGDELRAKTILIARVAIPTGEDGSEFTEGAMPEPDPTLATREP
jgi:ABC-type multidrug transport system fused ATPase/permease subunit